MATIGSLSVSIFASTEKFQAGIAKAQAGLKGFVSKITSGTAALGAFGAALSIGSLAGTLRNMIALGDALGDAAAKLGVTTQALQALRFASDQLGSKSQFLDQGLATLSKNLGELKMGSDSLLPSFRQLGISVDDLKGKSLDSVFLEIADAISKIEDPTIQAAVAQEIFGKAGRELLPILRAGTDAIIEQGVELQKTGAIFSDETLRQMDVAEKSLGKLDMIWEGIKARFGAALLPTVTNAIESLNAMIIKTIIFFTKLEQKLADFSRKFQKGLSIFGIDRDLSAFDEGTARRNKLLQELQGTAPGPLTAPGKSGETGAAAPAKDQAKLINNSEKQVALQERMAAALDRVANGGGPQLQVAGVR